MKKVLVLFIIVTAAGLAFFTSVKLREKEPVKPVNIVESNPLPDATPLPKPVEPKPEDLTGKQIIVFALDGSRSLDMWQESLDFSKEMVAKSKPVHFTYFISGVYLLTYQDRFLYKPPLATAGTSKIGFADSEDDLTKRIDYINRAVTEGHEIGSHLNGHFDGSNWSLSDWEQEFHQFNQLVSRISSNSVRGSKNKLAIGINDIIGFRAPNLGRNIYLYQTLNKFGYLYDTSSVGKLGEWPKKENGLWEFGMPQIQFANTKSHLLAMDYNFYIHQTNGKDLLKAGTTAWQKAFDEVNASYENYFNNNYSKNKAPVYISHHFSKWNDGVYWEVFKKFAEDKCGQVEIKCVTYKELADYLIKKQ